MIRRSEGAPLEQSCVRPGLWLIEGYQVLRREWRGKPGWWIYKPTGDGGKTLAERTRTLGEARDWIRQQLDLDA